VVDNRNDGAPTDDALEKITSVESAPGESMPRALDACFDEVYTVLRRLARRELRRSSKHTIHTTELVHEAYVKVYRKDDLEFDNELKFFRYAAMAMRHILLDRAMRRMRVKFGGDGVHVSIENVDREGSGQNPNLALDLDVALNELAKVDPRAAQVVELHYFAGLSLSRVGELIGLNRRTVDRDWAFARAFLAAHIPHEHHP
jgi:RNA polymerase sigma factor (TIGR02999 family)